MTETESGTTEHINIFLAKGKLLPKEYFHRPIPIRYGGNKAYPGNRSNLWVK